MKRLLLIFVALLCGPSTGLADSALIAKLGYTSAPSDDVGFLMSGDGGLLSGAYFIALSPSLFVGIGASLARFGGREADEFMAQRQEIGSSYFDFTKSSQLVSVEFGAMYVLSTKHAFQPLLGLDFCFGSFMWTWGDFFQEYIFFESGDRVRCLSLAPSVGFYMEMDEEIGLMGGTRFRFSNFASETADGWIWDLRGGSTWEVFAGLCWSVPSR